MKAEGRIFEVIFGLHVHICLVVMSFNKGLILSILIRYMKLPIKLVIDSNSI